MTYDFDSHNDNLEPTPANQPSPLSASLGTIQRDRFELLSAYLDGEVTAAERKQVEEWLANDPTVQQLHTRLLKLRHAFQTIPTPSPQQSAQETVDQVFARVERKSRLSLIWGGAALAALFVGVLATLSMGDRSFAPQIASSPEQIESPQTGTTSETLLVALDRPLVAIPKAPVAQPAASDRNSSEFAPNVESTVR
ncbi:zf-HC2 domain-containing protein [Kovacikia minuta CCNUW1]|uniref:anti-sigma factor family protein n=1 Tax=Kovacikia minuta TaxID=2931930 RepID=UPI001CCD616E|nr:zf-HC2 domain-containing protein [Kovacikia minuta]UBF27972.1 zf-HC2 domain-containing protein [Kovacikia minuta CCNUW1]